MCFASGDTAAGVRGGMTPSPAHSPATPGRASRTNPSTAGCRCGRAPSARGACADGAAGRKWTGSGPEAGRKPHCLTRPGAWMENTVCLPRRDFADLQRGMWECRSAPVARIRRHGRGARCALLQRCPVGAPFEASGPRQPATGAARGPGLPGGHPSILTPTLISGGGSAFIFRPSLLDGLCRLAGWPAGPASLLIGDREAPVWPRPRPATNCTKRRFPLGPQEQKDGREGAGRKSRIVSPSIPPAGPRRRTHRAGEEEGLVGVEARRRLLPAIPYSPSRRVGALTLQAGRGRDSRHSPETQTTRKTLDFKK